MDRGKYIIIDGIEAIGKEGLKRRICEYLNSEGKAILILREPGGTQLGEMERALLKEPVKAYTALREKFLETPGYAFGREADSEELLSRDPWAEVFEYLASRASSATKIVLPAIERGNWVVTDRAWTSTFAYQGFGRFNGDKEALKLIAANHKMILGDIFPGDRIYVIDITVEESFRRMKADQVGRTTTDFFDNEKKEFFENVRNGYMALKKRYPKQVRVIDGMRTPEEIFADIQNDLTQLLDD